MSDSQRRAQFMKSGPSNKRGFDLISDALPFGRLWYGEPNAISNTTGYAKFYGRSHDAVIRVFDESGATGRSKSILRFILMVNRTSRPVRSANVIWNRQSKIQLPGWEIGRRDRLRIPKSSISRRSFLFQKTSDLREENAVFGLKETFTKGRVETSSF